MQPAIDRAIRALPEHLLQRSGAVMYSGPSAYEQPNPFYILGLNPGGNPGELAENTIERSILDWRARSEPYSSYVDELWGHKPGEHGIQPKLRHLAEQLGIDLRTTPASNVVFVRTRDENALRAEAEELLSSCWPVHQAVIESLQIETVICLGGTASWYVREMTGADEQVASYQETNKRGWTSTVHRNNTGRRVATLTHPARADWRNPLADPSKMLRS